jgi:hypothetical protein
MLTYVSSASGCLIRRKYQNAYLLIAAHKHVSCSPARGTYNHKPHQTDTCANGAVQLPFPCSRMNSQLISQQSHLLFSQLVTACVSRYRARLEGCPSVCCRSTDGSSNDTAVEAITDKLSEVTGLAEQLDATLCGMQNGASIKRILDGSMTTTPQVCTRWQPSEPSGHYTYHQFNIQQFYVLPTRCIRVFVWI